MTLRFHESNTSCMAIVTATLSRLLVAFRFSVSLSLSPSFSASVSPSLTTQRDKQTVEDYYDSREKRD